MQFNIPLQFSPFRGLLFVFFFSLSITLYLFTNIPLCHAWTTLKERHQPEHGIRDTKSEPKSNTGLSKDTRTTSLFNNEQFFYRCHAFAIFSFKPKKKMHHSIYPVKFGKYVKFHLACVAGGIREDISNFATLNSRWNKGYCIVLYCIFAILDSSPILSRLRHSCSRLRYQNKSTCERNPASYAG